MLDSWPQCSSASGQPVRPLALRPSTVLELALHASEAGTPGWSTIGLCPVWRAGEWLSPSVVPLPFGVYYASGFCKCTSQRNIAG